MTLRIAERWFERKTIDDQITLLWEPHVHPILRCNIWHIRGRDRDLLVDTGMGVASLREAAKELFSHSLVVVITHTHIDHCGGAHEFDTCLVHQAEADNLRHALDQFPLAFADWSAEDLALVEEDAPIGEFVISARPSASFDPNTHRLKSATPASFLGEGDIVDIGDRSFEVLHLPGHSPGSIGLWEKSTGTLFSGDAIYDGPLLDELPGSDKQAYVETMQRLLELPVNVVHGGHENSFGRDRLRQIVSTYLEKGNPG